MADGAGVSQAGLTKGARITGDQRTSLATTFGERYAGGESIRSIAVETGRSYGFVHGVLKESGASLRGRGGATRGPRRAPVDTIDTAGSAAPAATEGSGTTSAAATKPKVKTEKVAKAKAPKDDKGKKKAEPKKAKKAKKG